MGRYLKADRCLDCLAPLSEPSVCATCGLPQSGKAADHLRWVLGEADVTLAEVRAGQSASTLAGQPPSPPVVPPSPPVASWPVTPPPPPPTTSWPATTPQTQRRRTLPALSTPLVLLGLGAVCLLVGAIVFVSVAWSDLSLGIRTLLLVAVTMLIGAAALGTLRRGLRGSAEALSTLFVLLLGLDVEAAHTGGLAGVGALSQLGADTSTAAALVACGVASAMIALRLRLYVTGVQWCASIGAAWLAALAMDHLPARQEYTGLLVTLALLLAAYFVAQAALWRLAANLAAIAVVTAATTALVSLRRVVEADSLDQLWGSGAAVGWLICCVLAASIAQVTRFPSAVRQVAAGAATTGVALLLLRPLQGAGLDVILPALASASVVFALAFLLVRSGAWHTGSAFTSLLTGCLAGALLLPAVATAALRVAEPCLDPWRRVPGRSVHVDQILWAHDVPSVTVACAAAALAAVGCVLVMRRPPSAATAALIVASAVAEGVLQRPISLYAVVATLGALVAVAGLAAVRTVGTLAGLVTLAYVLVLLAASAGSAETTSATTTALALTLATVAAVPGGAARRNAAAAGAVVFTSTAASAGLHLAAMSEGNIGIALTAIGAVVLVAAQLPLVARDRVFRVGLEVGALLPLFVGPVVAGRDDSALLLPLALTVAGASLAATALLSPDRRSAAVPGALLLAAASWVRLAAQDVSVVEAYTLPSALALCGLGLWRMRTAAPPSSWLLAPGLSLALLPSLLRTLPDPTSLRALLLGIAALSVLLAGAQLRWLVPLLAGSAVALVLAVLNIAPYAAALPRWLIFASVGAGLLALGVTWEHRLRDARNLTLALQRLR
ncbi:MAG: DUF2157 domain-containing protein [Nocardioidaceae bacterium]